MARAGGAPIVEGLLMKNAERKLTTWELVRGSTVRRRKTGPTMRSEMTKTIANMGVE